MSLFVDTRVHTGSSESGRPRTPRPGIEERTDENPETGRNKNSGDTEIPELPPNENLKKNADEVYGDTEIPGRQNDA